MSTVIEIYITEFGSSPMKKVNSVELESGKGIIGDRYHRETGTHSQKLAGLPDKELTLVESECIDSFNQDHGFSFKYGEFRRNIVTEGINLNELEGKEFSVGSIRLRGVRLCEPCAHLAKLLDANVLPALVHKGGLRAQILDNGTVQVGDSVKLKKC